MKTGFKRDRVTGNWRSALSNDVESFQSGNQRRDYVYGVRDLSCSSPYDDEKSVLGGQEMINPDALKLVPTLIAW